MKDFTKIMESASMKAQARVRAFQNKEKLDPEVEEVKRKFVKAIMKNTDVLQDMMKLDPQSMNDLIQRYGGKR